SGWGYMWTGDPNMGYGPSQPGGWAFNILSFIEGDDIRSIGMNMPGPQPGGQRYQALGQQKAAVYTMFHCPSRREAKGYPAVESSFNAAQPSVLAKTDYAANGGTYRILGAGPSGIDCLQKYPDCAFN